MGRSFDRVRERWGRVLERLAPLRGLVVVIYAVAALAILAVLGPRVGRELFPNVTGHQFRLRFDAPTGTRAEETARLVTSVLEEIQASGRPGQRGHQPGLRRHARRELSHQHGFPVDQRAARSGDERGAAARRGHRRGCLGRKAAGNSASQIPGLLLLVRARRHRQPDYEFWRANSHRTGGDGPGLCRPARLHGKTARRVGKGTGASRPQDRAAAQLSQRRCAHEPRTGGPTGRHGRAGGALAF